MNSSLRGRVFSSMVGILALSSAFMAGATADTVTVLRVGVELRDGSYILGHPTISNLAVRTSYAVLNVNLEHVSGVTVSPGDGVASVTLRNGDRIKGVLETEDVRIESLLGGVALRRDQIVTLRVLRKGTADAQPANGLLLHYTFDADAGPGVVDESSNGFDGTKHGEALPVPRAQGHAMVLSTTNEYVDCPVTTQLPMGVGDDCSFSFWWRTDAFRNDWSVFLSKRDNRDEARGLFFMYYPPRSCYYLHLKLHHYADFGVAVEPSSWNHVALVKKGIDWKVYHNGVEVPVAARGPEFSFDASRDVSVWLGRDRCSTDYSFQGEMDDFMIYKRALSVDEIRQLHKGQK